MTYFKKTNKRSFKQTRALISGIVAVVFILQTVVPAGWAVADAVGAPFALDALKIPEFAGRVDRVFVPTQPNSNFAPVILIQDAHGNPQAQKNIALILNHLEQEKKIQSVGVEGAFGEVSAELIRLFPDNKSNQQVVESLIESGELTGAEYFGFHHPFPIQGVDDPELYEKSFSLFVQVKKNKTIAPFFIELLKKQERSEQQFLSKDLRRFVRVRRHWSEDGTDAVTYFNVLQSLVKKHLNLDLRDATEQFQYPQMVRMVIASELEERFDLEKARFDAIRLRKVFQEKLTDSLEKKAVLKRLSQLEKNPLGEAFSVGDEDQPQGLNRETPRRFFEKLYRLSREQGIALLDYPALLDAAGLTILKSELDVSGLLKELKPLEDRLTDSLTVDLKSKKILELDRLRGLLKKLLSLSLSLEEYHRLLNEKQGLSLENLLKEYDALLETTSSEIKVPSDALEPAFQFYQFSAERDRVLAQNELTWLQSQKKMSLERAHVLIAGGFHQEGILKFFESQNIPFALVTPRIEGQGDEGLYEQVMLGLSRQELLKPAASYLNPQILLQTPTAYREEVSAPERRAGAIFGAMTSVFPGKSRRFLEQALRRGEKNGFFHGIHSLPDEANTIVLPQLSKQVEFDGNELFSRVVTRPQIVFEHGNSQGEAISPSRFGITPIETFLGLASYGGELAKQYSQRTSSAQLPLKSSRSEVRSLDKDAQTFLSQLGRNEKSERVQAAIEKIQSLKRDFLRDHENERNKKGEAASVRPLLDEHVRSLPNTGPPRVISVIEEQMRYVYDDFRLVDLPIPYRAAFVMAALDQKNFPDIHTQIKDILKAVPLEIYSESQRLTASDYMKMMRIAEVEHLQDIDSNILIRAVISRFIIDLPRLERRILEKEAMIGEFRKELHHPGTGDIPQIVFFTDLHGALKVGDAIAKSLGLKNYRNVQDVEDLEKRLEKERINLETKNILFVGGSDYPDRGPAPYRAFTFVRWLRDKGKLKFINGNHDLWKDWNLFGTHFRVNDTLNAILNSGQVSATDVDRHLDLLREFVTDLEGKRELLDDEMRAVLAQLFEQARGGFQGASADDAVQVAADKIINMGSNPNHSLEWWAREWYAHAGWADVMLDEINIKYLNDAILSLNQSLTPAMREAIQAILAQPDQLPSGLAQAAEELARNLSKGVLFETLDRSVFKEDPAVKEALRHIQVLKARNEAIRQANLPLAAEGRFSEMASQNTVPTTFPVTARLAEERLSAMLAIVQALRDKLPDLPQLKADLEGLATPENYNQNASLAETALWNMQNFRLVYVDIYGNAYLHGILPIDQETMTFDVHYKGRHGIEAIEYMQYDIRRFFEKFDTIPNTPEFRRTMQIEVGEAFQILNTWYSDTLAHLKPQKFQEFLDHGGPMAFASSFTTSSAFSPRFFDPSARILHVGHLDLAKMQKQGLGYWINGMMSALINGDRDISEEYMGLGGVVTHFMRTPEGLKGVYRLGYVKTVVSLNKELEALNKKLKKMEAAQREASQGDQLNSYQEQITRIQEAMALKEQELLEHQRQVDADGGETMEDITLFELSEPEIENARPFTDGRDLVRYYYAQFLKENLRDYQELAKQSQFRNRPERAKYYTSKAAETELSLKVIDDVRFQKFFAEYIDRDWDSLTPNEMKTIEIFYDFFKEDTFLTSWAFEIPSGDGVQTRKDFLKSAIQRNLSDPLNLVKALLNGGVFAPANEYLNLRMLDKLGALTRAVQNSPGGRDAEMTKPEIFKMILSAAEAIEKVEYAEASKMPLKNSNDRERRDGRLDAGYHYLIRTLKEMGRSGYPRLIEFLEPGFSSSIRKEAGWALRGTDATSYLLNLAMNESSPEDRRRFGKLLDQLGTPAREEFLFFLHNDKGLFDKFISIIGNVDVTYSDLLISPFFKMITDGRAISELEGQLEKLAIFAKSFKPKEFQILLKNWGFAAVSRWALDPQVSEKRRFFEPLYEFENESDWNNRAFLRAIEIAEQRRDAEFTRGVLQLLLQTKNLFVLRGLVSIIAKDPTKTHLISFLITQMKLMPNVFAEDDFIQEEISRLLYSEGLEENYYLIRKLASVIPHARRATGNESGIRNLAHEMDRRYDRAHPLFRYLRLKLHASPSTSDGEFVETVIGLLMNSARESRDRRRLNPAELETAMSFFKDEAKEEVAASLEGDVAKKVGTILRAVAPDPNDPKSLLLRGVDWTKAPFRDSREFETARNLADLIHQTESRYGKGLYQLNPERQRELDGDSTLLLPEIETWAAKRREIKASLIAPGVFDPDDDMQVTKHIEYKRHVAQREWGFLTVGYYAQYREGRFESFEEDRSYEHLIEKLYDDFIEKRIPDLYVRISRFLKLAPKVLGQTTQAPLPTPENPREIPEEIRGQAEELLRGLETLVELMAMDGTASPRLRHLTRELRHPGLTLQQVSNILGLMQEELQLFLQRLLFVYGDYPAQTAATLGPRGVKPAYVKPGDASRLRGVWADRVQETMMAELFSEERSVQTLKRYLQSLREFLKELPAENYLLTAPAPSEKRSVEPVTKYNFDPETTSFVSVGSKGWELLDLSQRGFPVPPLAVIPTEASPHSDLEITDPDLRKLVIEALLFLEKETGRIFPFDFSRGTPEEKTAIQTFRKKNNIDLDNALPLILSARSGAPISMPGMMETAVNVPVTDEVVQRLMEKGFSPTFAYDLQRRFLFSFGTIHSNVDQDEFTDITDIFRKMIAVEKNIPLDQVTDQDFSAVELMTIVREFKKLIREKTPDFDNLSPFELLLLLVQDIYRSWESDGANRYRERFGISSKFDTAVTFQQMFFGNFNENSGTVVADSSDAGQGIRHPFGNVLIGGQGVELVAGLAKTAKPLNRPKTEGFHPSLEATHPKMHAEIMRLVSRIEAQAGIPVNTELTFENGKLYLLQARPQIVSAANLQRYLEPEPDQTYDVVARGEPVSGNAAIGRVLNARGLESDELLRRVLELRKAMDAAGEEELDIILIYDYFTDDDSSALLAIDTALTQLDQETEHRYIRSIGILNSGIAQSNHASLIATKLGFAYVGEVDRLRFNDAGQILLSDQVIPEGLQGDVYSIDAHGPLRSSLSGAVIKGAIPYIVRYPAMRSEVRTTGGEEVLKTIKTEQNKVLLKQVQTPEGVIYTTQPKKPIDLDDSWSVQQYLRQVYNALSNAARDLSTEERLYSSHEVQVRDEVVGALFNNTKYSKILKKSADMTRASKGFVDAMDLFRILSKLRGKTEIAAYPDLRTAQYGIPQKIALVVDASVSDLEAVFFRDLIGNPNVALEVVVGTTPAQLAATLNHSIYRRFLRSGDVQYNQEEGWIKILGRMIRVVKNEEGLTGSEWQALGVRTFVATHSIRRRAKKIAQAVSSDTEPGEPTLIPIRIIALENINPFKGKPPVREEEVVSLELSSGDAAVKMKPSERLLRAALLDMPVRFLTKLRIAVPGHAVENAVYSLNYTISPLTALPLDESGRAKSPTQNQIPVSADWTSSLRGQIREALNEASLPDKALQTVSVSSIPAPMGDRLEITMQLRGQGINELLKGLNLDRAILRGKDDFTEVEKTLREKFIERLRSSSLGSQFRVFDIREAVNTDTRYDRHVFIDQSSLQVSLSQGADQKLALTLAIPLVFNRDWQNSRHLLAALSEISRQEAVNRPLESKPENLRLSPYGVAVEIAKRLGTLPPEVLQIPEKIDNLREKPLQIGVVGFAGQIGARLHVQHDLNLNIAAAIGGAPADVRNSFYDSIVGPLTSNGRILAVTFKEFQPPKENQVGTITIGDGSEIPLLRRYDNPLQIPWSEFGVEVVAETTGAFTDPTDPQSLLGHLKMARGNDTGADAVILSAPFGKPKDASKKEAINSFPTVVFGANDNQVTDFLRRAETDADLSQIISNASCTTNCVATMTIFAQRLRAAVTQLMRDKYQLKKASLGDVEFAPVTSVHALTNTQPGFRDAFTKPAVESRHRAGPQATITKSGVSDAILQLRFSEGQSFAEGATGYAVRVPIATSLALVPLIFKIEGLDQEETATLEGFNHKDTRKAFQADVVRLYSQVGREMAADPKLSEAVAFGSAEDAITSEIVAGSGQIVIDAQQVHVLRRGDRLLVTGNAWYDNVTNYAQNYLRIMRQVAGVLPVSGSTTAKSEVRALFGWGKRQEEPVSDNLVLGRISAELALAEIDDDTPEMLDALLRMARAVLEEYTDFKVDFDERTVIEPTLEGTEHIDMGTAATNSMQWGNIENPGEGLVWVDKEVVKKVPKIVPAGTKRSEVRALFGWGKRQEEPVSDNLVLGRISAELALAGIDDDTPEMLDALLRMARAVLEEYTDFKVDFDERMVIEKVLEGTEHIDLGTAATNSMQWGNLENPGEGLVWVDKEVMKKVPKIISAGTKRSEVRMMPLEEIQLSISEVLSYAVNAVDRLKADEIKPETREQIRQQIDFAERVVHDENEVGDLRGVISRLIETFRRFQPWGEDPARVLEGTFELIRVWEFTLRESLSEKAQSEVRLIEQQTERLRSELTLQGRSLDVLLTISQIAARNVVDQPLAAAYPAFFKWRLFNLSNDSLDENRIDPAGASLLPALQDALRNKKTVMSSESMSELPKTIVLASINGQVPVVDFDAMQFSPGSRVIILDSRGSEALVWKAYERRLPKGVRIERGTFEGSRPDLGTLKNSLTEKGALLDRQVSRALLILPYVTEKVLEDYSEIPLEEGLVVRTPRLAQKNKPLRFAFSYFLGRGMLPAQLLKETPPDVFQVRVHSKRLSPAYVPLGSEGRFASWTLALAARELLEAAA